MANIVGTLNKKWKFSSSISKSANSAKQGRSASIFITSTDYSENHDSISLS